MKRYLLLFALCGCPKSDADAEKRSTSIATAKDRVAYLCDYVICPTKPEDVAFHIFQGEDGTIVHAVVKLNPSEVHHWSAGCDNLKVETRPKWLAEVMGPTGWTLKTIPDTWRCSGEKRVIHVKEAIVIRSLLRPTD